jgi:TolB protein
MNRDGSGLKQLTTRADNDYLPSFTPDGSQITFISWRTESRDEKRSPHIYIMNSDGSGQRRLVEKSTNTSSGVSWHPSGQKFVYASKVNETAVEIMEADRNGNLLNQLTRDNLLSSSAEYSPDGLKIAFHQNDGTTSKIIVMNADGTSKSAVINEGMNYYPHWSPDGSWITFTKQAAGSDEQDYDIYAVSISNVSEVIKIIDTSYRDTEGSWEPQKIL